jgi:beta-RFAP synthase
MGFIDISGVLGRRFGSIGVALNELGVSMRLTQSDQLIVKGFQSQRARIYAELFFDAFQINGGAEIIIDQAIPEHAGLGSGTQMALSIGVGLSHLYGLNKSLDELVALMGRGNRSGIGIGAFCRGGLVVDGGRAPGTVIPPVVSQLQVPDDWRFILILDTAVRGIHGESEVEAFNTLPEFPAQLVAHLCHLVFMRGLPAVIEDDLMVFGEVITELQASVGDHFAAVQGGRFTSQAVERAVLWLGQQGAVGLGQSSWGPTGFCMVKSDAMANQLVEQARLEFAHPGLEFMTASVGDTGAIIEEISIPTESLPVYTEFA